MKATEGQMKLLYNLTFIQFKKHKNKVRHRLVQQYLTALKLKKPTYIIVPKIRPSCKDRSSRDPTVQFS